MERKKVLFIGDYSIVEKILKETEFYQLYKKVAVALSSNKEDARIFFSEAFYDSSWKRVYLRDKTEDDIREILRVALEQ